MIKYSYTVTEHILTYENHYKFQNSYLSIYFVRVPVWLKLLSAKVYSENTLSRKV